MNSLKTKFNLIHKEHNIIPPFYAWLYSAVISDYSKKHTKHKNNLCQKSSQFLLLCSIVSL